MPATTRTSSVGTQGWWSDFRKHYRDRYGTSEVVFAVSLWFVYVSETALGLLAQRLFTVSTAFADANVVDVREVKRMRWLVCPTMRRGSKSSSTFG